MIFYVWHLLFHYQKGRSGWGELPSKTMRYGCILSIAMVPPFPIRSNEFYCRKTSSPTLRSSGASCGQVELLEQGFPAAQPAVPWVNCDSSPEVDPALVASLGELHFAQWSSEPNVAASVSCILLLFCFIFTSNLSDTKSIPPSVGNWHSECPHPC